MLVIVCQVRDWHVNELWVWTTKLNVLDHQNWTAKAKELLTNLTREVFLSTTNKGFDGKSDFSTPRWNFAGALLYSVTVISTIGNYRLQPLTQWLTTIRRLRFDGRSTDFRPLIRAH